MMFFPSNHERGERHSLSALQESRAQRLRIHCYWFRHLFHAQTICCSLTFDMWSHACGKGPYSLSHKRREVTSSFPHRNAPTEEDKTRHQFNRNVLVLCHDIISCHLSPLVICGLPAALQQPAEIIAGVMDWPVDHLVPLLLGSDVRVRGRSRRCFYARAGAESAPVSRVQTRSCRGHGAVKWKACHSLFRLMPSDCERLCHVPWLLTQWLGTSRQKPEPVRALCVLTEKCVFHLSSHWPEDSGGLTCPRPQSLTSWTQK